MNDPKVQGQEPTMEEILASIRRIISEGEDPNAAGAPAAAPAAARPAAPPRPAPASDGVLELTDMVGADGKVVNIADAPPDQEVQEESPTMAEPTERPAAQPPEMPVDDVELSTAEPAPSRAVDDEALIGAATAAASTAAFAALAKSMQRDSSALPPSVPIGSGRTLEELVAEMIRPMLRDWLDSNLPSIIERMVKREIERIVRRAED